MPMESQKSPLRLEDLDHVTLKASDAFLAMGSFLKENAARLRPETALVTILSGVEIEESGMSGDPAYLTEWLNCVEDVLRD